MGKGLYHPVKIRESTWRKVVFMKGVLEQAEMETLTIEDTVDRVFQATINGLADANSIKLPPELSKNGSEAS